MKVIETGVIYENPIPQLRSRQSMFPWLCKCGNGRLAAIHVIGEAFESADQTSYIAFSDDEGKTWSKSIPMYDLSGFEAEFSNCSKAVSLPDGRLIAIGYGFCRADKEKPVGNPETGGLLDDMVFYSISEDCGKTWSSLTPIECSWGPHVEASAPLTILKNGSLITPITGFPNWDGKMLGPLCGKALRSDDGGKTWSDSSICMEFQGRNVTCYEQRMCQLDSGIIICIAWNENVDTGERMPNHYTYSEDNGITWSEPISTSIMGQASSVCAIGGERFLALHSIRRDTDKPGVYAYVVDFSDKQWNIVDECVAWEPVTPIIKDTKMAEIFSFLKFGQPGAILLDNGDVLMSHWYAQEGQYKTVATRIKL
ncbi:MAG: exo-alpha-sialidase [Clostridia bacterium]|nr:exo-alpha-sialidase [Clostridia bacterium]